MADDHRYKGLRFACECVSANGGYSDPRAEVAQKKLLPDGTKEQILNLLAGGPKTIAQLAGELRLSQPSVHKHVTEMTASELLRESEEWERNYPAERYYEPNFPVVTGDDQAEFEAACWELALRIADLFVKKRKQLEFTYDATGLKRKGWSYLEVAQYLYARIQREAREVLEGRGELRPRQRRRNGAEWLFWAEKADTNG